METSAAKKRTRDSWGDQETENLIHFIKEKNIPSKMDSKRFRNDELFASLETEMKNKGYTKDKQQIVYKYNNLKSNN